MRTKEVGMVLVALLAVSFVSAATVTIRPDGQGHFDQWNNVGCSESAEWDCVDEVVENRSDRLRANVKGKKESFTYSDTGLTTETITHLRLAYMAKKLPNGFKCFRGLIRINGTNYLSSKEKCANGTWSKYTFKFEDNPATGQPWTAAELDDLEAGMKATGNSAPGGKISQAWAIVRYEEPAQTCGNNIREGTEVCDGTDLDGETCATQGFDGGTLACNGTCDGFDTSGCFIDVCGDSDGNDAFTSGNVTGEQSGVPYVNLDTCINTTWITEWTCVNDLPVGTALDCRALSPNLPICFSASNGDRCLDQG